MTNIPCNCCSAESAEFVGKIPDCAYFSGNYLDVPLPGGGLYRCRKCNYKFRYPQIDKSRLDDLYKVGAIDNWNTEASNRNDWSLAKAYIDSNTARGSSVLDVGCFTGEFLTTLESSRTLFGVEINEQAAAIASNKGVNIIGKDFSCIEDGPGRFDVITAFDVIEHVENPRLFLASLEKLLKDDGHIIIGTGNSEALPWKLYGSRCPYCTISEHISFLSEEWCDWVSGELNLKIMYFERYVHTKNGSKSTLRDIVSNSIYLLSPKAFGFLRKIGFGESRLRQHESLLETPPSWASARDHFMCVFKKNGQ